MSRSSTPTDETNARTLTILYATETGNAQDAADRIARHCRRIHFQCRVCPMETYPVTDIVSETLAVFVVSTTGTGKEPRAMTPLWNMLLRSDLPPDLFEDLEFAVFGLGDTAYEKFCWPAKKLSRRLQSLGAKEICPRGEGDDQHTLGIDGALGPWIEGWTRTLLELFPLPSNLHIDSADALPPPRVSIVDALPDELIHTQDPLIQDVLYHNAKVLRNDRITAEDWFQDVRHFELQCEDDIAYEPGDVAVIHPEASSIDVDSFLTTVGWANDADQPIRIKQTLFDQSLPDHLPPVSTLRTLFSRYLDINAVPRRSFFDLLRHFTTDDREREKLDEFVSTPEGAEDMYDYTQRVRRTIREVLEEFRSARIPKTYIFDLFPRLRPREFSIASSVQRHPHEIHLCVAIVAYRTKLKIPRRGLCTTYLATLRPGDTLRVGIKKGVLSLPPDPQTPVICIGPGTGIAPMRAVLEQRIQSGAKDNTLYFGCRSATKDQHYHAEWAQYAARGELVYRVACSRDGPEGAPRVYVQDRIAEDARRVWELIGERGAWVYISGSSNKMPLAVRAALVGAARNEGGMSEEDAKAFVARMEREGRLLEECWS